MMNPDFARAIIFKTAFHLEPLRRAQAALIYVALAQDTFTADALPGEIVGGDTKLPGLATGSLASLRLIESVCIVKSPAKSRHGGLVRRWRLAQGKRSTALTWLKRNGFDGNTPGEKQPDLLTIAILPPK
jgi:hypothetical protein